MRDGDTVELWLYGIAAIAVALFFFAKLPTWMKGGEERSVLIAAGYTNIKLKGFRILDCPDLFGMGFEAKGPNGNPAKGAVCKGIFTGASIRLKN